MSYTAPQGPSSLSDLNAFDPVHAEEVRYLLDSLEPRKAPGPDGIPPALLKLASHDLAPSLALIFNSSLQLGVFPTAFRIANITPVLKDKHGDRVAPANYRPISLTSVLGKVLEKLVLKRVTEHWQEESIFHDNQFGFLPHRSTTQLLAKIVNDWHIARDANRTTAVAFIDLSKAFDKVRHQMLLLSLHSAGIGGAALQWFSSYLQGRSQRVVLPGNCSDVRQVTSGVPQGTILGPILFNIYVRNLPQLAAGVGSELPMFADDMTLYYTSNSVTSAAAGLTSSLSVIHEHLADLGLSMNMTKSVVMFVQKRPLSVAPDIVVSGTVLNVVPSVRCLGVLIDDRLTWTPQVDHTIVKVCQKIGILRRCFRQLSPDCRRIYLVSVILPDFEYAVCSYITHVTVNDRNRIFSTFRRAVRAAFGAPYQADVQPLLLSMNLQPLESRFISLFAYFTFKSKVVHPLSSLGNLFPAASSARATRGTSAGNVAIRKYASKDGVNSFQNRAALFFNALPGSLKSSSCYYQFRNEFSNFLRVPTNFKLLFRLLFENVSNI